MTFLSSYKPQGLLSKMPSTKEENMLYVYVLELEAGGLANVSLDIMLAGEFFWCDFIQYMYVIQNGIHVIVKTNEYL